MRDRTNTPSEAKNSQYCQSEDVNHEDDSEKVPIVTVSQLSVRPSGSVRPQRRLGVRKRFRVLRRSKFRCHYCGRPAAIAELEIDHVIPISCGGTDAEWNLVAACTLCNRGKADIPLFEFVPDPDDDVVVFVRDRCRAGRTSGSVLYAQFLSWAQENMRESITMTAFGRRLTQLGHLPRKSGTGGRWRPLSIKPIEVRP